MATARSFGPGPIRLERVDPWRVRIPPTGDMQTSGLVYASPEMAKALEEDNTARQVANVACLPGIVGASLAMPDCHWGYGFPIGGVAAFDATDGIVSPGGVGYDINCGVRLLSSTLPRSRVEPRAQTLVRELFAAVPTGTGRSGEIRLQGRDLDGPLSRGAAWAVEAGHGLPEDLDHIEEGGCLASADPSALSPRARERGGPQLGTLGSGNHFLEVDRVETIFDHRAAEALGLVPDTVVVLIHSGSRGLGHQVCTDFLRQMNRQGERRTGPLADRQLIHAPVQSPTGRSYLGAMGAAVNYAFANRQILASLARRVFRQMFGEEGGLRLIYDVAHNIAKVERHQVQGKERDLIVHRKGATRAYGPGHPQVPVAYREVGQPVLIPGDMGRYSYVLLGTEGSMRETFGSTCHGAGRRMSRKRAMSVARGRDIAAELRSRGIQVKARSREGLAEEISEAYKDVSSVVEVVEGAGISRSVARLVPLAVIKG